MGCASNPPSNRQTPPLTETGTQKLAEGDNKNIDEADIIGQFQETLKKARQTLAELEKDNISLEAQEAELDKRLYPQLLEKAVKKQNVVIQEVDQECSDDSERQSYPIIPDDRPIDCSVCQAEPDFSQCPKPIVKYKSKKSPTCFTKARIGRTGKDKLIVVSLSTGLKKQAKNLQESFIQVFSDLKKKRKIPSFTLLTVQAGSKLNYPLLTHRDVQRLSVNGRSSIRSKIEDAFQFGAGDLRALRDLGVVDGIVTNNVGRILYITDNVRLGTDKPSNNQRGIPLAWKKDGIRLAVLTTQGCKVWVGYTGAAACTSWFGKKDLVRELKAFLK